MLNIEEGKNLQWVKGDKAGSVETISSIDDGWISFQNGGRISYDIISEFMIDISEGALDFNIQPDVVHTNSASHDIGSNSTVSDSVLMTLLKKMSKTDTYTLNVSVCIKIPTNDMYNVLIGSFDEEEVDTEIEKYLISQINNKEIKESIMESAKTLISDFKSNI
jgi:hypothetical protein